MQKEHVFRLVLILALVVLSVVSLFPTLQLGGLQKTETAMVDEIKTLTGLTRAEIESGLTSGNLESLVRRTISGDTLEKALELSDKLIKHNSKITRVEGKSIRQGLDLQGGTYLVYEVDLPQLLRDKAKNKDSRLEDIITATIKQSEEGIDFFTSLQENFTSRQIGLNRYFGSKGQTDEKIIEELQNEATDAIDRTLENIRNRIDQFGVSEPSIQKEGNRRIVVQLAGIQNIQRAKAVIGKTALLEFKLVKDADIVISVINDIDRVMRKMRMGEDIITDQQPGTDATQDTTLGEKAEDKQVSLSELFGDQADTTVEADTTGGVVVDQKTFSEKPFSSLLRQLSGRSEIFVPLKNEQVVQRILQIPEVVDVLPGDAEFLWGRETTTLGEEQFLELHLVKQEPELLGSMLTDAQVQIGGGGDQSMRAGAAEVHMELNNEGSKKFAVFTGMNVGKFLAIVLDNKVATAPRIKEKIPSGSARIEVGNMDEAKDLALVLRAGALPAPIHAITENTVGPSLGRDSIDKGKNSAIIGLALVVLFMIFYYRGSGVIADFALFLNIIFVLAFMAGFHATLTMPGIAGIILTVGMAVDANVLIFERIREELRTGKTIRAAIDSGYSQAFRTILDANVTTLITAVVLYSFGTGPIKGFALTLSIGIIASMFTAIVVTRLIFDMITARFAIKKLSI
ncbi:MAG TPA: protein translocase subunit SecD [bacterium]|nr:protein translocase subunit SecD [bacterium]HPN42089.1 protein translocase subunit SecD [bacterium]